MKELNESGRSMVEMLGVLAIIGVLSVGGIAGYTQAMKKYRANNLVDCISKVSIAAQVAPTGATDPTSSTWCTESNYGGGTVTGAVGTGAISFSGNFTSGVCTAAQEMMGNTVGNDSNAPGITWATCS